MRKVLTQEQKDFAKLKKYVQKRAPGAKTVMDLQTSAFIVVDEQGEDVVSNSLMLPPATTVRRAWEQAKYAIWYDNMMKKSNAAFSEEKIWKKLIKESGGE